MAYLALNSFPGTGAVMQVAISFAGNRPDAASGSLPYFDPANVKAEIIKPATATTNEVVSPTPLVVVNATTFKTTVPVPVGSILRVFRETLIDYPMVDFVDRQTVTENDLDTSSRQVLYAAMEALDKSNLAIESARQGLTFAVTAVNTANAAAATAAGAVTTANSAAGTANTAAAAASAAVQTANAASAAATQAAKDAASAEKHATNVETLASQAQAASAAATATANQAKQTAEGIDAKATSAQSSAAAAVQTANAAKTTAEGIDAKAQSALDTADDASTKAASAKATAEGIDAKATAAQQSATSANSKADSATNTANAAKTTADGLATKVDAAQSAANAAQTKADQANQNANERVSKAGDTMTGELKTPSWRVGTRWFNGNGLSADNANGYARVEGDRFYLDGLNALYIKALSATSAINIQALTNNGAARGVLTNNDDGSWSLRTGNSRLFTFGSDGYFNAPTAMYANGKQVVTRGDTVQPGDGSQIRFASNGTNFGTANGAGFEALQVTNGDNPSAGALMSFHRLGNFAAYFGLDTDNQWAVGGWSMGARRFKLWHEGNLNPPDYVRYDNLRQELGGRGVNEVGTTVLCQTVDGNTRGPGDLLGAGGLRYASHNAVLGYGPNAGTFRCLGYGNNGGVTLWLRIN